LLGCCHTILDQTRGSTYQDYVGHWHIWTFLYLE